MVATMASETLGNPKIPEDAMNLLSHFSRSLHQLQQGLHRPVPCSHSPQESHGGALVLTVTLLSVAAAAMLVLAP